MKKAIARKIIFHGEYADRYTRELTIYADSMFAVCNILFKNAFPQLSKEKALQIVLEDNDGNRTELFDPYQSLQRSQSTIHIIPNPDGAYVQAIYAIIIAIVSVGIAMMLAPKIGVNDGSGSGSNFDSVENVIGQGGAMPIVLGTRRAGSRVVSQGLGSTVYLGRASNLL